MTEDLTDTTVRLMNALLDSASTDVIGVSNWWARAKTALETAAAGAENAAHAVTIASRKLQIDTLTKDATATITEVGPIIDAHFSEWTAIVARESVYIVALTRVSRDERRAKRKQETLTIADITEGLS